jgi:hypothetical protein
MALEAAATVGRLAWPAAAAYLALPLAGLGDALAA